MGFRTSEIGKKFTLDVQAIDRPVSNLATGCSLRSRARYVARRTRLGRIAFKPKTVKCDHCGAAKDPMMRVG